jgi:Glutathione S-transferase, N-terminal domain
MHRPVTLDHTCQCSAVPEVKLWRRIRPITTHDRYGCRRVHVPREVRRAAMKLYDLKTGTNTRRVRIFLAEKGVKLPTVEVDMMKGENKSPDYLAKNLSSNWMMERNSQSLWRSADI